MNHFILRMMIHLLLLLVFVQDFGLSYLFQPGEGAF